MVLDKIKQVISEQFNISKNELTLDTSFVDDLNADSLDVFQIIMAIEEELEIEISNEEAEKIDTIGDVAQYIQDQKGLD